MSKLRRNTHDERDSALAKALSSDSAERKAGLELICQMYSPLIETMAARYWQPLLGAEREELLQVARVGLLEAVASFKTKRVNGEAVRHFSEHARWCIRHELAEYLASIPNPVKLPSIIARQLSKMRREVAKFRGKYGSEPTVRELSTLVGLSISATEAMLVYDDGPVELDKERSDLAGLMPYFRQNQRLVDNFISPTLTPEEAVLAKELQERIYYANSGNGDSAEQHGSSNGSSPRRERRSRRGNS